MTDPAGRRFGSRHTPERVLYSPGGPAHHAAMSLSSPPAPRARRVAWWTLAVLCVTGALAGACVRVGYVVQAGLGQLEMIGRARPIEAIVADAKTDERTRYLLSQVQPVLAFAEQRGLRSKGNYRTYVDLDREAAVWFMATSRELSFEPKVWGFPIVGSFTYLGWFSEDEALRVGRMIEREGWDVYVRPARAYSTGGWFNDPVSSTMLSPHDDALRELVNVLLHELTHANLLIRDQSTFNESLASFVGDTMAEEYLTERFGARSAELAAFREEAQLYRERGARLAEAYRALEALYASDRPDAEKRADKARLLAELERTTNLWYTPNNAALMGFKTYNAGLDELARLYQTCDRSWPRFLGAVGRLTTASFGQAQDEDIGPVIDRLTSAGCPAAGARLPADGAPVASADVAAVHAYHGQMGRGGRHNL